jgi:hypothetical protein
MLTTLVPTTLLAALVMTSTRADGQASPPPTISIAPESAVRMKLRGREVLSGRVIALTRDSIVARWATGAVTTYPLSDVETLEVADGAHRPLAKGAFLGIVIGATLGAGIGAARFDHPDIVFDSRGYMAFIGAGVGASAGLLVGLSVGSIPRVQWRSVPLAGKTIRINLQSLPAGGGGAGLALAF